MLSLSTEVLINKILEKKSNFIFRVGKNNNFVKNISVNSSSAIFNYNYNNVTYKLKIYKYNSHDKITLSEDEIIKIEKKINENKILTNTIEKKIIILISDLKLLFNEKNKEKGKGKGKKY